MSCQPCTTTNIPVSLHSYNALYNDCACSDCGCDCNGASYDARCVFYTGPNLPCAQIETNQSLEDILIKVDQKLCATIGNYSTYNKSCLDDDGSIITEQQFVETISAYVCDLRTDLDEFTTTTYTAYQTTVNNRFVSIEQPNITCGAANVINTDSLTTVLNKYCGTFQDLYDKLSLSTVAWDSCYTVNPDPVTIAEAFNVIIGQICDIKNNGSTGQLPTFNNEGTCLPAPLSANDSLENTITKIRERLCETPTLDINTLTWGCTAKPSDTATDLQGAMNAVLAQLSYIKENLPTFSADFSVTLTDSEDVCQGKTVALAPSGLEDKYVTVTGADATPGTLAQKLIAGTGVELDVSTVPGTMIINITGGVGGGNSQVKMRSEDPTAGYLKDKIEGSTDTSGIEVVTSPNTSNEKVTVGVNVDFETLWTRLLEELETNSASRTAFCAMVQDCLPDCIIPPNVTVIYSSTDSTTTSTTTTTTTTAP